MSQNSNSLSLLSENYLSDDSDDSANQFPSYQNTTKKEKLPLPYSIQCLFESSSENVTDSLEQHEGRIRSFPHERGNWATCVFVPYDYTTNLHLVCDNLIKESNILADFHICADFHISLSRTVVLRHHWIDLFVDDLSQNLKKFKRFFVDCGDLTVFNNDENTRTFIAIKIEQGYNKLLKCVELIDQSLKEFRLPTYYENPSFHISLLWCVGNKTDEIRKVLPKLQIVFESVTQSSVALPPVHIDKISCKIGNRLYNFALV